PVDPSEVVEPSERGQDGAPDLERDRGDIWSLVVRGERPPRIGVGVRGVGEGVARVNLDGPAEEGLPDQLKHDLPGGPARPELLVVEPDPTVVAGEYIIRGRDRVAGLERREQESPD